MMFKVGDHDISIETLLAKKLDLMCDRVMKPHPALDALLENSGAEGEGKCLVAGSKVLMADGSWKNVEDVKEGDLVMSPQQDGSHIFAKVTGLSSWHCENIYDVMQLNKVKKKLYSCSNNHPIPINICNKRRTGLRKYGKVNRNWSIKNISAEEYARLSWTKKQNATSISSFKIKEFMGRTNCKVEPYTLGVYLGDGSYSIKSKQLVISSADPRLMEEISKFYPLMNIGKYGERTSVSYFFSLKGDLARQLVELNLHGKGSGEKFIPREAMLSDAEYRLRLLAGLIDTDGYYSHGGYVFTLKSKKLIEDIRAVVYSLGGRTGEIRTVKKKCQTGAIGTYHSLTLYMGDVVLPLKKDYKIKNKSSFYLSSNRLSIDVKLTTAQMVYGFSIDSPSHWFITDNWMVTHNSNVSVIEAAYIKQKTGRPIHLFFKTSSALKFMQTHEKALVILDEPAFESLSADALTRQSKDFLRLTTTMRVKRHFFIINFTKFWKFPEFLVVDRALGMVHMYSRANGEMGRFLYIRKRELEKLWNDYKKMGLRNYGKHKSFGGKFTYMMEKIFKELDITVEDTPHATFEDYNREKDKAIASIGEVKSKKEIKSDRELREMRTYVARLKDIPELANMTDTQFAKRFNVSTRTLQRWRAEAENGPSEPENGGLKGDVVNLDSEDGAVNINTMVQEDDSGAGPLDRDL